MTGPSSYPFRPLFGVAVVCASLAACQFQQKSGPVQAVNPPQQATRVDQSLNALPPSQRRPPVVARSTPITPALPTPTASQPAPPPAQTETAAAPPQLPSFLPLLNREAGPLSETRPGRPTVPPPATTDTVCAALLLPLSGRNAKIGKAMLNAAQLAVFDFADNRFELLPHDTRGTPEGATVAAQNAIGDGATIILGPLLANSARAVAPTARAAGVPVISFSNDRSVAGNGTFTLGFLPSDQVERVARFANAQGVTRFAALAPANAYGRRTVRALENTVRRLGATLTQVEFYDPFAQDFTDTVRVLANYDERRKALLDQREELEERGDELAKQALKRLENLQTLGDVDFEALLVADGGKRLLSVAALLPFFDIDPERVRMLGTGQWDEPGIGKEPALIGGWYAAPPPSARAAFAKQYADVYGAPPPRLVTMAYDATALASVLARADGGPDFSMRTLTNASGFWGRDGVFRFLADGTAERGLAVLQVGSDVNKVIQPAPETFEAAIN